MPICFRLPLTAAVYKLARVIAGLSTGSAAAWGGCAGRMGTTDQHTVPRVRSATAMPTDHAPELAALAKRLADAKEFL